MIVRYLHGSTPAVGVAGPHGISQLGPSLAALLRLDCGTFREAVVASAAAARLESARPAPTAPVLLAPVDGWTEIWAAGVTYKVSQRERIRESTASASVYEQVYGAERPELFFKAASWRAVGDGGFLELRDDSTVDVPEPELAVVVNPHGEILGYSICNDLSSRSIEGENPLYLPQAKIFDGSCGLGPGIVPAWEVDDPHALAIAMEIERDGATVWSGAANTDQLHRRIDELVGWLFRHLTFPDGVWLSTGTCLVPELPFTLAAGDIVSIAIEGIGTLTNTITRGSASS
jgi:2-dehydro-3-deoxy-D-arabinonate dehydratase